MKNLKLAYVMTDYDHSNIKYKFGIGYYITRSLEEQGAEITCIGGFKEPLSLFFKAKSFFYKYIARKRYYRSREPFILRNHARRAGRLISRMDIDAVISFGSLPVAFLKSAKPVIYWTDATFAGVIDYYTDYSNLCNETLEKGHFIEQSALDNCRSAVFSSEWAARSALDNYRVEPSKLKVIEFGANIESEKTPEEIALIIKSRSRRQCKLLFIGVDWDRKGGDSALKVIDELNRRGIDSRLHVVGCQPGKNGLDNPNVVCHGFISKQTAEGRKKLEEIFATSHFLVFPSKADCSPIVLPESNSLGLPCITSGTGGIPSYVTDNVNGHIFDFDRQAGQCCDFIESCFNDRDKYFDLAFGSYEEYCRRLNWRIIAEKFIDHLRQCL